MGLRKSLGYQGNNQTMNGLIRVLITHIHATLITTRYIHTYTFIIIIKYYNNLQEGEKVEFLNSDDTLGVYTVCLGFSGLFEVCTVWRSKHL